MSSPIAKSVKRLTSRSTSRHSSATSSSRKRVLAGKSTRLKPATKRSPAGKAPARKAAKVVAQAESQVSYRFSETTERQGKQEAKETNSGSSLGCRAPKENGDARYQDKADSQENTASHQEGAGSFAATSTNA